MPIYAENSNYKYQVEWSWQNVKHRFNKRIADTKWDEPRHDKTNKMSVHPSKTQISLGICPVWSEYSLSAWRKLGSLANH